MMRNSSLSKLEIMREAGSLPDGNVLLGRPDSYQALQEVLGICFTLRQLQQSGGINRIPSPSQNKEYQSVRTHAILDLIIDLLLLQDKLQVRFTCIINVWRNRPVIMLISKIRKIGNT